MIYIDASYHPYFKSLAKYVQSILTEPSEITDDYSKQGTWILNYASYLVKVHEQIKGPYIAIQSEQMKVKGNDGYRQFLKGAEKVWDMEQEFRIGYSDHWRLEMEEAKDIDVLFFGLLNDKRLSVLQHIPGLVCVRDYYGPDIMKYVMRSKIILSTHYYNNPMNDMARIAPLLSNKAFVLAERTSDEWFNNFYPMQLQYHDQDYLKALVKAFLQTPKERIKWQDHCYDLVKSINANISL